jgi:D-sedoheptulose 7-phosphate isomerase
MESDLQAYFRHLAALGESIEATGADGHAIRLQQATDWAIGRMRAGRQSGNSIVFVGNGGSAGIASHLAIDYSVNGGFPALAFNDAAALTCLGNDFGYEFVFSKQVEHHGRPGDLLFAISSSGNSQSILNAVAAARDARMHVLTLSGFSADNQLRKMGDVNLYVPNSLYGLVEISHLAICHALLDIAIGEVFGDLADGMHREDAVVTFLRRTGSR